MPNVLNIVFENKEFSVFIGKEVDENSYVSIDLITNYNYFEVNEVLVEQKKTNSQKELFLIVTGSNVTFLSDTYFSNFITTLKNISHYGKSITFRETNSLIKEYIIEASSDFASKIMITLTLDKIKIVLPLISFLPIGSDQKKFGIFLVINNTDFSILSFYTIKSCFDFFMNGDKNTIGFKLTRFAHKLCSIS